MPPSDILYTRILYRYALTSPLSLSALHFRNQNKSYALHIFFIINDKFIERFYINCYTYSARGELLTHFKFLIVFQ